MNLPVFLIRLIATILTVSIHIEECSTFSYSYRINHSRTNNSESEQISQRRSSRQIRPQKLLLKPLDRNLIARYENLCEYGQRGVYVGYLSERLERCYYLCGENHPKEQPTEQLYHCCPTEARLDFSSKLCVTTVTNNLYKPKPKKMARQASSFVTFNQGFIEKSLIHKRHNLGNDNFENKRRTNVDLHALYEQNVQEILKTSAAAAGIGAGMSGSVGFRTRNNIWNNNNNENKLISNRNRFNLPTASPSPAPPLPLLPPEIKSNNKCKHGKSVAHSTNPNHYYYCVFGRFYIELKCPDGLIWNDSNKICMLGHSPIATKKTYFPISNHVGSSVKVPKATTTTTTESTIQHYYPYQPIGTKSRTKSPSRPLPLRPPPRVSQSSFVTSPKRRLSKTNTNHHRGGGGSHHYHHHRRYLRPRFQHRNSNRDISNEKTTKSKTSDSNGMLGPCLNRWQSKFYKRKYNRNCLSSTDWSTKIKPETKTKFNSNHGNSRRKFWNTRYSTKSQTVDYSGVKGFIPATTKGLRPGMLRTTTTSITARPIDKISQTTQITAFTKIPIISTTINQTPEFSVQQTEFQESTSKTQTSFIPTRRTTAGTTKFPTQQTEFPIQQSKFPVQQTEFPGQQTESQLSTSKPQTSYIPTRRTTAGASKFPVQQTEFPFQQSKFPVQQTKFPTQQTEFQESLSYAHSTRFPTTKTQLPIEIDFTVQQTEQTPIETKFPTQQTESQESIFPTTETSKFPIQQTTKVSTTPITQTKFTETPTTTEFSVQLSSKSNGSIAQTESSTTAVATTQFPAQKTTEPTTYSTIKPQNKIFVPIAITLPTTEFSATASVDQQVTTAVSITADLLPEIPEIIPEAEALNITTTTETAPMTSTVRLPEEFEENSACYDLGARYRDSGDCQCFYYCQMNGQLSRSCCPEGQFFNQIETNKPMENEEEVEEIDENQYCDLQDNVKCKTIIQ